MTPDPKVEYLEHGGIKCPYCKSRNLKCGAVDLDGRIVTQEVECEECHKSWTDIFQLINVHVNERPAKNHECFELEIIIEL